MLYLVSKLLHIFLIVSWFAGLFYLPRIFVNLASVEVKSSEYQHLLAMARRLFRFMTPIGIGALILGIVVGFSMNAWSGAGWAHAKLLMGFLLAVYHYFCWRYLRAFELGTQSKSHVFFRYFNEIPVFLLLASIYLAVFKPF